MCIIEELWRFMRLPARPTPALFDVLIKATGTPIDRYSYDTVETLRDMSGPVGIHA